MSRKTCVMCRLSITGPAVPHGKGYRHPECEKPARGYMPKRPLTPGEQADRGFDKREERRQSSDVN